MYIMRIYWQQRKNNFTDIHDFVPNIIILHEIHTYIRRDSS
jgi:hypothetical protein